MNLVYRITPEKLWKMMRKAPHALLVGPWPCFFQASEVFPPPGANQPFATLYWHDYEPGLHHTVKLFEDMVVEIVLGDDGFTFYVRISKDFANVPNPIPIKFLGFMPGDEMARCAFQVGVVTVAGNPATGAN